MSDNWLQYIPTNPEFIPTINAANDAVKLLEAFFPLAEEVKFEISDSVNFYHPGANWSGVECLNCGVNAESWWDDVMDQAAESQFRSLTFIAPCCGAEVSLNNLKFIWPAAFGSFVLEAMNPRSKNLSSEQFTLLESTLECSLREVAVHL
nr:hypothetical protein [uncultured Undibacterium sp.]